MEKEFKPSKELKKAANIIGKSTAISEARDEKFKTLSEKMIMVATPKSGWIQVAKTKDIKEFIKKLKKVLVIPQGKWRHDLEKHFDMIYYNGQSKIGLRDGLEFAKRQIDKLAGKDLI